MTQLRKVPVQYFMIPVNPEPWAIGPISWRMQGGKRVPFVGSNTQLLNYQQAVRNEILQQGGARIISSDCDLRFYFWRRLDQYQTTKSKAHARHVADATNLQKALEDALQGPVVTNDRLVRRISSEIVEQSPETDPGILVVAGEEYVPQWANEVPEDIIDNFYQVRYQATKFDLGNEI